MSTDIPSARHVRGWLKPLTPDQLRRLAVLSGVPFGTLWKIRAGTTSDPRIETVRAIAPHVDDAKVAA